MIQILKIHCPACQRMVDHLVNWREIGDTTFYLCEECKKKDLTTDEILRVGFFRGYEEYKDQVHKMSELIPEAKKAI